MTVKVSWKSIPYYWWNPLATNLALHLLILPSLLCLSLNTRLQPTTFYARELKGSKLLIHSRTELWVLNSNFKGGWFSDSVIRLSSLSWTRCSLSKHCFRLVNAILRPCHYRMGISSGRNLNCRSHMWNCGRGIKYRWWWKDWWRKWQVVIEKVTEMWQREGQ